MKLLEDVRRIVKSYDLKPIKIPNGYKNLYALIDDIPEVRVNFITDINDHFLITKYKNNIDNGHYGFSIGTPIVPEWNEIVDKILELCIENDPDFRIRQIKIKFGLMCFYVKSDVIEDINEIEIYIMNNLRDNALKY